MMFNSYLKLKDFTVAVAAMLKAAYSESLSAASLKIVDEYVSSGNVIFVLQAFAKSSRIKMSAHQILSDPKLMGQFNEADKGRISAVAEPCRYKLVSKAYHRDEGNAVYTVRAKCGSHCCVKNFTAKELCDTGPLFNQFSSSEIADIRNSMLAF